MFGGTHGALAARWIRALSLLSLVAGIGCGDSDGPSVDTDAFTEDPDAGPIDNRTFLELCAQPELYCSRLYECAEPDRLAEDQFFFDHTDEASCVVAQQEVTGALCAALNASLEAERLTVDLPKLRTCTDHMELLACHDYVHADPTSHVPCQGSPFLAPNVPVGGECAQSAECMTPGDLCTATDEALGECVVAPLAGEPCLDGLCGEGMLCVDDVCIVPEGGTCLIDWDCDESEWCDQPGVDFRVELEDPELEGQCTPRLLGGANCEDVGACVEGFYCEDTHGADDEGFRLPGHCAEPRESGAACNEPADCISFECTDDICE
ncbi:MAG: hypothetical protein JJ863_38330 [Deltaproteobacteria bacterium]|nr:hypothetical protein [Deltaproteobacteria bacterium]